MKKTLTALLVISAVAAGLGPWPVVAQTGNLITNGGFETDGTNGTAAGWDIWWREEPRPPDGSLNYAYRPSWNLERRSNGAAPELIRAGDVSQRVINSWDPWWGGVRQTAAVPAGARVRLTAQGRAWTAMAFWPAPSDTSVGVRMQVGLDPDGGTDPFSANVVWSPWIAPHDGWQTAAVEASVGAAGRATAFLSVNYRGYSRLFMGGFWDEVALTVVSSGAQPTPTRLAPTATTIPPATPAATATRLAAPSATTVPTQGAPTATAVKTAIAAATIAPPAATATPGASTYYLVQRGDTLWGIARRFGVSVQALIAANGIANQNLIYVGQRLSIPAEGAPPAPTAVGPAPTQAAAQFHVVQPGDTLWRIAWRNGISVQRLKQLNGLTRDLIYVGQRLRLR